MMLSSDYVTPAELTGFVRQAAADLDVNAFTLSRWLPSTNIDDLQYRFSSGGEGLAEAATFRAYDAESPIGSRPGIARTTGELPPVSRKIVLGEYDRLRLRRSADDAIRNALFDDAERMTRAVLARIELARGQALVSGSLTINENGVAATVNFGRAGGHTVAPSTLWSVVATATPLQDLMTWRDVYSTTNGTDPGAILTSRRVVAYLMRSTEVKNLLYPSGSSAALVSEAAMGQVLVSFGLPPIYTYEAKVNVSGAATRVIADDKLIMLPAPGASDLGATLFGTTAESLEADFGLAGGEPGMVAGSYSTKDPVALWTKAAAIALPVLANPNLSLTADVC